jgi:hypothetical protein
MADISNDFLAFTFLTHLVFYWNRTQPSYFPHSQTRIQFWMPLHLHPHHRNPRRHLHLHLLHLHPKYLIWRYRSLEDPLSTCCRLYFQESIVLRNDQACWCACIHNESHRKPYSQKFVKLRLNNLLQSYLTYKHWISCS